MSLHFDLKTQGTMFMDLAQSHTHVSTPPSRRSALHVQLRKSTNYLFVAPMLLFMTLTLGYSIFSNIQLSLYDVGVSTFRSGTAPFVGLDNYLKLLRDPAFLKSVG